MGWYLGYLARRIFPRSKMLQHGERKARIAYIACSTSGGFQYKVSQHQVAIYSDCCVLVSLSRRLKLSTQGSGSKVTMETN